MTSMYENDLRQRAAELGYALVPVERIKTLDVNYVITMFDGVPQEAIDKYIRNELAHNLADKLIEYKKLSTTERRTLPYQLEQHIHTTLQIIIPRNGAP